MGSPAASQVSSRVVPLPAEISDGLKRQAGAAMSQIKKLKKKKRKPAKKRAITHDKTKMSMELFGAGIDTPDWPMVKRFLKMHRKKGLGFLLMEASPVLRSFFGVDAKLVLEVLKSPVRRSKRACLYLVVKSKLSDEGEGQAYDDFVDRWWAKHAARAMGLLTIGIASDDDEPVADIFAETKGSCLSSFETCHVEWCRFHLHSDVHSSSIAFQKHGEEACTLRLALRANHTLEEIGELFGCTRERIRQIETVAMGKVGGDLIKCGVIPINELSKEVIDRLKAQRRRKPFIIEDDHLRHRGPGRPRKSRDEDGEEQDDGDVLQDDEEGDER
jgi:hypothetical protein